MTDRAFPDLRLRHQQISHHQFTKPRDVVAWMGAMQAQDFPMARWAVAVRLPDADKSAIQRAIDRGQIIRTHLLRPTWHLVDARDVAWMMDLTAPHIKTQIKFRHKELGLTPAQLRKSLTVFEQSLAGGNHLTRDELLGRLHANKIDTSGQRASHILVWAELEKVICSGAMAGNKITYALFDERIRKQEKLSREEALGRLAQRYFSSRGPATLQDFINWSALPITDARAALELVRKRFLEEKIGSQTYLFLDSGKGHEQAKASCYLLPAFDEYIIGYKDRSAVLSQRHRSAVISMNGIFWPIIVINGLVTGLWKRSITGKHVSVGLEFFSKAYGNRPEIKRLVETPVEKVRQFFRASD